MTFDLFRYRGPREARLRPKFGKLYPSLPANEWCPAKAVRCLILHQWRLGNAGLPLAQRVLYEEHFDFRGSSNTSRVALEDRRVEPRLLNRYFVSREHPLQPSSE